MRTIEGLYRSGVSLPRRIRVILLSVVVIAGVTALAPVSGAFAEVDSSAPVVAGFDFVPTTVDISSGAASTTFTIRVTEDISGFDSGVVRFYGPSSGYEYRIFSVGNRISGDALDGVYESSVTIPQHSPTGTWTVQIYLTDQVGNGTTYSAGTIAALGFPTQLEVIDNQPPVADPNGPYSATPFGVFTVDGTGSSDPDGDPMTYSWYFADDLNGPTTQIGDIVSFQAPATPGIYPVELTVDDGIDTDAAFTYVVVYDPSAGFVTGGGWIDSPAGAYAPDTSLTGKATFGFVSKYKKGAEVPTGNTEFQFKAGDLNFHSSSYQWLVVTGSDAAKFKGVGTINGAGEYRFMIWAGDNEPDTFRIKIWTEGEFEDETVVYDNGSDQTIGGGSIVIHTSKK
jgi:hypothetical protein